MYNTQIALIGTQKKPVIDSIQQIGFNELVLVYSPVSKNVAKSIKKKIDNAKLVECEFSSFFECFTKCFSLFKSSKPPIALNFTGGSKIAALGAIMASSGCKKEVDLFYLSLSGKMELLPPLELKFKLEEKIINLTKKLKILSILSLKKTISFQDIMKELKITKGTLSYHLKFLEQHNLIKSQNTGKKTYYSILPAGRLLYEKINCEMNNQ